MLKQGIDLLRQRFHKEDLQRTPLKLLLEQRSAGAFVIVAEMDILALPQFGAAPFMAYHATTTLARILDHKINRIHDLLPRNAQ